MIYYAHTCRNASLWSKEGWQLLKDHLENTAKLTMQYAKEATNNSDFQLIAWWTGLLHDLGKYQDEFQEMLETVSCGGTKKKVQHACFGSVYGFLNKCYPISVAIAGHHAGMPNVSKIKDYVEKYQNKVKELIEIAKQEIPALKEQLPQIELRDKSKFLDIELYTRMLFSCLVDADCTDTAGYSDINKKLNAELLYNKLMNYISEKALQVEDGPVKKSRNEVLEQCIKAAKVDKKLFSLTVPTGGGKTFASMAFALKKACLDPNIKRIFVVLPYLSIIEQNAKVYKNSLGAEYVIEHHSGITNEQQINTELDEDYNIQKKRIDLAVENWDAPIIITTSVRFFESLFSNRPRDLRRMHNIANSVVILDEVQTIPRNLMSPITSMLKDLSDKWGTTFVFCTATQPAFERNSGDFDDHRWKPNTLHEIIDNPTELFKTLERTYVIWPKKGEKLTWEEVADQLVNEKRALCVVNIKKHAKTLYQILKDRGITYVKHLSTNMCAAHRLKVINEIKDNQDQPCILISTQLIEAGVDLDFPVVYRAMAPLDSIVQAAGRCDREGKATKANGSPSGKVVVFVPDVAANKETPPGAYQAATNVTKNLVYQFGDQLSINNPKHITRYFNDYYSVMQNDDHGNIQASRCKFDYPEVNKFALIDENMHTVIIEYNDETSQLLQNIMDPDNPFIKGLLRKIQAYTISMREYDVQKALDNGALYELDKCSKIYVCRQGFYNGETGFNFDSFDFTC